MFSSDRDEIQADYDALRAVVSRIQGHSYAALTNPERLSLLAVLEQEARRLRAPEHALINQLVAESDSAEIGGKLSHVLADRLRITRCDAGRRIAEAADLGVRRALTGEALPPLLTGSAAAQRDGAIGPAHVQVIRRFFDRLPCSVGIATREKAEAHLAELATKHRPEDLAKLAEQLNGYLNPDGTYSDEDRARQRGLTQRKQDLDGMSKLTGWLTPEARATLEAVAPASGRYPHARWPLPDCATPKTTRRSSTDRPPRRRFGGIPARRPSATTTASTPHSGHSWHRENSAGTTGYRPPSS